MLRSFPILLVVLVLNSCAISPLKIVNSIFEAPDSSGVCDIYISDLRQLEKIYQKEFSKFEIQPNEVVAEIGANNFFFSLANMCFVEDVHFYVQDINLKCLTEENLEKGKEHFTKLRGLGPLTGKIEIFQGEQTRSNLPYDTFDKVILRLVYHELKEPEKNLQDIYQILKPEGILLIGDDIAKNKNKVVKCGVHRTEANLIQEVEKEGFQLEKVVYSNKKGDYKIFKFRKK